MGLPSFEALAATGVGASLLFAAAATPAVVVVFVVAALAVAVVPTAQGHE